MTTSRKPLTHALAPLRLVVVLFSLFLPACAWVVKAKNAGRPNILLIITDDQGWGDLGFHGNPVIRTPNLDRLAAQGVELTRFYASPVCSPTRASLMTGRYNYRTGIVDTYMGRSMMHADEVTLAEVLRRSGYATGLFGKWHLGDHYPLRAMDQGFDESLCHLGGGLMQHSDPPGNNYFDPVLLRNGVEERHFGYCADIFTDAALDFVRRKRGTPFFAYVAFNTPHTPLVALEKEYQYYKSLGMRPAMFPDGKALEKEFDADTTARVYAMVENIDTNVGRLLDALDREGVAENTIVIFLTDNGPQQPRYNGGMRGLKGTPFEGGIRVPCLIRWPGRIRHGGHMDRIAAHIDLVPTLLDWCDVEPSGRAIFDGVSLAGLVEGKIPPEQWPDRSLYFQWHRGNKPEEGRALAVVTQRHKLAQAETARETAWDGRQTWELFDLESDPAETTDISAMEPALVSRLKQDYSAWFHEVTQAQRHVPPAIVIGNPAEPVTVLTRQDWRDSPGGNGESGRGHWIVEFERAGDYQVEFRHPDLARATEAAVWINGEPVASATTTQGVASARLVISPPAAARVRLEGTLTLKLRSGEETKVGAHFLVISRATSQERSATATARH